MGTHQMTLRVRCPALRVLSSIPSSTGHPVRLTYSLIAFTTHFVIMFFTIQTRKNHRSSPGYRNHNGVDSLPVCDICLRPAAMNMSGISETFLACSECTAKGSIVSFLRTILFDFVFAAHPSCLNYSTELIESCRKSDWQCSECKTCMMCTTAEEVRS
jgi:hypothetical protein